MRRGAHLESMSQNLPIVPMRNGVLFPGMSLPISAARPVTLKAIEAALHDPGHRVFVVAQRENQDEVTADGLYTVGTIATLSSAQRGIGGVRVALEGLERGTVSSGPSGNTGSYGDDCAGRLVAEDHGVFARGIANGAFGIGMKVAAADAYGVHADLDFAGAWVFDGGINVSELTLRDKFGYEHVQPL